MNEFIAEQIAKHNYPEHCDECGAYLATRADQVKHADWHAVLTAALGAIRGMASDAARMADHADSWHRPLA